MRQCFFSKAAQNVTLDNQSGMTSISEMLDEKLGTTTIGFKVR